MASAKYKNIDGIQKLVIDRFTELKTEDRTLVDIGRFTKERIQQQTRLGKSMVTGGKLKGLSDSYKDVRSGLVTFRTINGKKVPFLKPDERLKNVDPEFFEPKRSNLTFTGQLMKSLKIKIDKAKSIVEVFLSGIRKDGLTNQEVARFCQR